MPTITPRGTKDIYGKEMYLWTDVEAAVRGICGRFGFNEIRTPIFEYTELFTRSAGETSDVVQKEMYTFMDKGNRSITLRPEGTAGAVRAFVEHKMYADAQPTKLFYIGPNFRYEKPAAGRWRQHHQFGVELFGAATAAADAEIISVGDAVIKTLGIKNVTLNINSIGCPECHEKYNDLLKSFLYENIDGMCGTCRERLEKNPMRVLDCKVDGCKKILEAAPPISGVLCESCVKHSDELKALLTAMGINFVVNERIVRGLDYYTKTVFEFIYTGDTGEEDTDAKPSATELTVIAGGRYDGLISECGGPEMGAVGFGMGLERIVLVLKAQNGDALSKKRQETVFVGYAGQNGYVASQSAVYKLRAAGIHAEGETTGRSVKAQMKYADKLGATYAVIIGDDEINSDSVNIKNMTDGSQTIVSLSDMVGYFLKNN